ncbi:MAG: AAA family ATPase [Chloroflexi bacterium]|nr:AAA family ATPase [Chloroflexota bacterium]
MNDVIIAAAGSGKTSRIVKRASNSDVSSLIVTYTLNNECEIRRKLYETNGVLPEHVTVMTWFRFLLSQWIRPYGNFVYPYRVANVNFHGKPFRFARKTSSSFYIDSDHRVYRDRTAALALKCNCTSGQRVLKRLAQIFDHIYIDEVQDLRGYDLDLLEALLDSDIGVTLVGDNRQATFFTNRSMKYAKYLGYRIVDKFAEWENAGRCETEHLSHSFRCNQMICDFADLIFPDASNTEARNDSNTGHDGVFIVNPQDVTSYIQCFRPQVLRYDRSEPCQGHRALNYGDSKGLTFPRVLVFPFRKLTAALKSGNFNSLADITAAKTYVAVTRAQHSVAFVHDGACEIEGVQIWHG